MDKRRILIVEDNELNRKLVRTLLHIAGHEALETSNAEDALKIAREMKPDLVLMDIHLPGMDGLTATRQMKEDPDLMNIPVVALTACAMPDDERKALDAGCEGYISKPIETGSFAERINSFLPPKQDYKQENELPGYGRKILIVDDDPANVKLLMAKLSKDSYQFFTAAGGREALAKAKECSPDLILLDIMMPDMDGFEVTRRLKSDPNTMDIPIILITALGEEENKAKGLSVGADDFLNKPVNVVELQARVRSLLRLKGCKEQLKVHSRCEKEILVESFPEVEKTENVHIPLILLVEDEEKDAKLIMKYLDGLPYHVKLLKDGLEVLDFVEKHNTDLIILDILLPHMDGFEVCKVLKNRHDTKNIQILILTNLGDLESKIRGIELGADEYIIKPIDKYELRARIHTLINKKAYLDELCKNYESAFSSAIKDKITGLYNRSYFNHYLEIELKRCRRQKRPLALIMIDINEFKVFNDTHGHPAGDRVLRKLGKIIKENIRETDMPARYGGEKFVVVLPDENLENARKTSERLMDAIKADFTGCRFDDIPLKLSVSMGIAAYPSDGDSVTSLVSAADRALYAAKKVGKDRICMAGEISRN